MSRVFEGISASLGVAIGPAYVVAGRKGKVERVSIASEAVEPEIARFKGALEATRRDLHEIRENAARAVGLEYARIIDSHILLLEDPEVVVRTEERIRDGRENVDYAYVKVTQAIINNFESLDDAYFKERSTDILDVRERVLHHLLGTKPEVLSQLDGPVVVIAERLTPSLALRIPRKFLLGLATDRGGRGSHAVLLARSMEVPAVVGVQQLAENVAFGQPVILDGHGGRVIVDPDEEQIAEFTGKRERFTAFFHGLESLRDLPAVTKDGQHIDLAANIEYPEESEAVISHGAQGVGLYRSEFLLVGSGAQTMPTEEDHRKAYEHVARAIAPNPVTIRTFDVGGDKAMREGRIIGENPFLGYRAIRLCLGAPKLFRTQLRGLLRAAVSGNVKIMFPFISGLQELQDAKAVLEDVKDELRGEDVPFTEDIDVGIMIEVPSAAVMADVLAPEVDFFSVGTNDLTQYTIAADRNNELVDYLYEPLHPAVIRLLKTVVDAGKAHGTEVGICGELASDPVATALLLGLGFDGLSTNLMVVSEIKKVIRSLTTAQAREISDHVLTLPSASLTRAFLTDAARENLPWLEI